MDREFMEHYFEIAYNDVAGEIAGGDEDGPTNAGEVLGAEE